MAFFTACGSDSPEERNPDIPVNPEKPQDGVSAPIITVLLSESCVF